MKISQIKSLSFAALLVSVLFCSSASADQNQEHTQIARNKVEEQKHRPKTQADYEREAREASDTNYDEYSDEELVQDSNRSNSDYGTYSYGSTSFGFQPK